MMKMKLGVLVIVAVLVCYVTADEMISTPLGLMPASCVHVVGNNSQILSDKNVKLADGTFKKIPPCHNRAALPSGWTASAQWASPKPITSFTGTWTVPTKPLSQGSQTIYLFPALQNSESFDVSIMQPTLMWGNSGNSWGIASWYITQSQMLLSSILDVNPGDVITGNLTLSGSTWSITTSIVGGNSTTLTAQPGHSEVFAFVGVEAYNINTCDNYPAGSLEFKDLTLNTATGKAAPVWQTKVEPGCNEAVTVVNPSDLIFTF